MTTTQPVSLTPVLYKSFTPIPCTMQSNSKMLSDFFTVIHIDEPLFTLGLLGGVLVGFILIFPTYLQTNC